MCIYIYILLVLVFALPLEGCRPPRLLPCSGGLPPPRPLCWGAAAPQAPAKINIKYRPKASCVHGGVDPTTSGKKLGENCSGAFRPGIRDGKLSENAAH